MGTWHGPTLDESLGRILDDLDPNIVLSRSKLIERLAGSGLIVTAGFYVPDADELLGLMHKWQYNMTRGTEKCRWVMCRETVGALAKRYDGTRAPTPRSFDVGFWTEGAGAELPHAALSMEIVNVLESRWYWDKDKQVMLFGIPIRIDPAARSPLFEIDTDDTRRRNA